MFSKFSEEAQKTLLCAKGEMIKLKHPYIGSEHLILAILSNDFNITKRLNSFNITYDNFKNEIINVIGYGKKANNWFLFTPVFKKIIANAIYDSRESRERFVSVEQLFLSLLEEGDGVGIRILINMGVNIDKLYISFSNKLKVKKNVKKEKLYVLDYSVDFNKKVVSSSVDPVVCRDREVDRLIEILSRRYKNNPLLIGEAGVGKTAIVEELARRIVKGCVPNFLKNKRILSLSLSSVVSGTKYRGEFEERVNRILKEVKNDDSIILFIDEIHTIVGAGGAEGAIDASNILKPALSRGDIKIIGATTTKEYKKSIEKDKALDRRFQKIIINEPDYKSTLKILLSLKDIYSSYHNVSISDDILEYIVKESDKYINNRSNPDKSIDILDEVCAKASLIVTEKDKEMMEINSKIKNLIEKKNDAIKNEDFSLASKYKSEQLKLEDTFNTYNINNKISVISITKDMVKDVIFSKSNIPIYEDVCDVLRKDQFSVIGQDKIIDDLIKYTRIIRSNYRKMLPYSFLLLGPTGVGKTLLVKEYASILYNRESFIKVDMSEFREDSSINKIIGSPPGYVGYEDDNYILEKVRNNPYSVILLDEVEKASKSVVKLFLQVLNDGYMHDSCGRKVDFRNTIIFMTSNIYNNTGIGFNDYYDDSLLNEFFSIEFLNRIDKIYRFNKLDFDSIRKIVINKLELIKEEYNNKGISIKYNNSILKKIINKTDYLKFGARKIDKVIESVIRGFIIDMIINGNEVINLKELEV